MEIVEEEEDTGSAYISRYAWVLNVNMGDISVSHDCSSTNAQHVNHVHSAESYAVCTEDSDRYNYCKRELSL